jgi:hypothetical protein
MILCRRLFAPQDGGGQVARGGQFEEWRAGRTVVGSEAGFVLHHGRDLPHLVEGLVGGRQRQSRRREQQAQAGRRVGELPAPVGGGHGRTRHDRPHPRFQATPQRHLPVGQDRTRRAVAWSMGFELVKRLLPRLLGPPRQEVDVETHSKKVQTQRRPAR